MKFWDYVLLLLLSSFFFFLLFSSSFFLLLLFLSCFTYQNSATHCGFSSLRLQPSPPLPALWFILPLSHSFSSSLSPTGNPFAITAVAPYIAAYRADNNPCRELLHSGLLWQHHPCGRSCWGQSWLQFPAPMKLQLGRVNFDCFCCIIQGTLFLQNDILLVLCY